jgi:pimeloyl-ACP methyl ester carboxylesterase
MPEAARIPPSSNPAGAPLWAAHDAPERAAALVLLAPVLRDPPKPTPWYGRAALAAGFAGPWRIQFWLWYWDSLFPTNRPPDQAVYRLALGNNLPEPGRMDALKTMVHLSKTDTAAIVNQVKTPTLIVMGTKDPDFDDPAVEAKWASQQLYNHLASLDEKRERRAALGLGAAARCAKPIILLMPVPLPKFSPEATCL